MLRIINLTYRIEGRLWRSKYPFPGGLQNDVSAGGVRREGGRDPKVRLYASGLDFHLRGSTPQCYIRVWG